MNIIVNTSYILFIKLVSDTYVCMYVKYTLIGKKKKWKK